MTSFKLDEYVYLKNDGYGYGKGYEARVGSRPDENGRQSFRFLVDNKVLNLEPEEFEYMSAIVARETASLITKVPKSVDMAEFEIDKVSGDKPEAVKHPAHYGGDTTYEAIKVIEAWDLGFHTGNTVKYISRAGKKNKAKELEDIDKAIWYLQRHRENLVSANA